MNAPGLFPPEPIAEQAIRASRAANKALRVDLKQLEEEQRVVTGIHEVYGATYRQLGFDKLLPRSRYRASHDSLLHTVMARIANPDSKRGSVRRLEQDFGAAAGEALPDDGSPRRAGSAAPRRRCCRSL